MVELYTPYSFWSQWFSNFVVLRFLYTPKNENLEELLFMFDTPEYVSYIKTKKMPEPKYTQAIFQSLSDDIIICNVGKHVLLHRDRITIYKENFTNL